MFQPQEPSPEHLRNLQRITLPSISGEEKRLAIEKYFLSEFKGSGALQGRLPRTQQAVLTTMLRDRNVLDLPPEAHQLIAEKLAPHTKNRTSFSDLATGFAALAEIRLSSAEWGIVSELFKKWEAIPRSSPYTILEGLCVFCREVPSDLPPRVREFAIAEFHLPWDRALYSAPVLSEVGKLFRLGIEPCVSVPIVQEILRIERGIRRSVPDTQLAHDTELFLYEYASCDEEHAAVRLSEAMRGLRACLPEAERLHLSPLVFSPELSRIYYFIEQDRTGEVSPTLFMRMIHAHTTRLMEDEANPRVISLYLRSSYSAITETISNFEMHRVLGALGVAEAPTSESVFTQLNAANMQYHLIQVVLESRPDETGPLLERYNLSAKGDQVPYGSDTQPQEYQKCFSEVLQVYRRLFDMHRGFSALTFDGKRPPDREGATIARFGFDVAHSVEILNSIQPDVFPGRGVVLRGLSAERMFAADSEQGVPKLEVLKRRILPWASEEIDILHQVRFVTARGMMVVSAPEHPNYTINGIHYSYVVFNDHFFPPAPSGVLAPTRFFDRILENSTLPYEHFTGFRTDKDDLTSGIAAFDELVRFCEHRQIPLIDLGWGSNLSGLCNAFPPDCVFAHGWEKKLRDRNATVDIWGHVHKSYITGQYQNQMNEELDLALKPLRRAHDIVYRIAHSYQNTLDLMRLGLAQWHKGFTLDRTRNSKSDESNDRIVEMDLSDPQIADRSMRMLHEAYRWHREGLARNLPVSSFPVLCAASSLIYSSVPDSSFYLDTHSMTFHAPDGTVLWFGKAGIGDIESAAWKAYVLPLMRKTELDLRFYDRRELPHLG